MMFRRSILLVLASLPMIAAGCNVLGVAAYKFLPPPKRPAAYELAEAPTAVEVRTDPAIYGERGMIDAEPVAISLERALQRHVEVPLVDDAKAARQVIVVKLQPISSEGVLGSEMRQAHVSALVRVLDGDGRELWPADGSPGRFVEAQMTPMQTRSADSVRREMLRALGEETAALFYDRVIEEGA